MTLESSSNASSSSATYPKKIKLSLALELELRDAEHEGYILARTQISSGADVDSETLQLGFIADLFDIFNFESSLGVEKINGFTQAQVNKTLQAGL